MAKNWGNAEATANINDIARGLYCDLFYTKHAEARMEKRSISTGDVMQILKNGNVYGDTEEATRGQHKYAVEGRGPNSPRTIRLIVLAKKPKFIKIITVMWKDES